MDYFDSNFKNDQADHESELPEDFKWEDMKGGIYDKMQANRPSRLRKYWPFLILLLVAGCGTGSWFVMNSFDKDLSTSNSIVLDEKVRTNTRAEAEEIQDETKVKSNTITETQTDQTSESNLASENQSNSKKQIKTSNSSTSNSVRSSIIENSKSTIETKISNSQASVVLKPSINQTELTKNINKKSQIINESSKNKTTLAPKEWNKLDGLSPLTLDQIANKEDVYAIIDVIKTPKANSKTNKDDRPDSYKKHLEIGLAGGLTNWSAFDANNINHEHVRGYPGYTIKPSLGFSFAPKHTIQFDYEYSALEELFDYEGSRDIEVQKEDVIVRETHSSLTGNVISKERKNILVPGTRSYKEVKYNQYKFQTLSLGYRFDQITKKKSSFGFYVGASYLLKIKNQGKRLNEELDVVSFDNSNPIFKNNQFGLRLGLHYNYQLSANTSLFSQVISTKYLSNWELDSSASTTRPLFYGVQVGFRYRLMR